MNGIQLLSMTVKNYRQYEGETTLSLDCEGNNHINVIEGENGTGKSNLLNAITYCFFGEERHQENNVEEDAQLPYVNVNLLDEIDSGESVEGYIEIRLGMDEPEYIFSREFETFKTNDGYRDVGGDFDIKRKSGTDWEDVKNEAMVRNEILPPQVSKYFFFDGEQLQEFFDSGYKKRIRDGIFDVSHIELLERSHKHLRNVRSQIESNASNYEGKPKEIREQIEDLQTNKENKEGEIARTKQNIEETKKEIERIDTKLQDVTDEHVKGLYEKRGILENQLEKTQERHREEIDDAKDELLYAGPLAYSEPALELAQQKLEEMSKAGQLPPKIRDWFIDDLIEEGKCICGEDLDAHKIEQLEGLKQEVMAVSEDNLEGKAEIPTLLDEEERAVERLKKSRTTISEIDGNLQSIKKDLREIREELKAYDVPEEVDVPALETERERLESRRDNLISDRAVADKELEEIVTKIDSKETELKDEMRKEERFNEITRKLDFVDEVIEEIRKIKQTILSDIRNRTEQNIDSYYNELIWKNQLYNISLEEDYSIEVRNPHGENQLGSLSAGETQVLALSFMAALSQISGFEAPVVIDTPLGRISGEPKKLIAENISQYLENSQVTFLMTDQEYTSEVRALMERNVQNEYVLDFHEGKTEVQPYA